MNFEWDPSKAANTLIKHGVSFAEAQTVFENPLAFIFEDKAHSMTEHQEIIIGHSQQNRLLLISFTEGSTAIRIISARLATRKEREDYEQNTCNRPQEVREQLRLSNIEGRLREQRRGRLSIPSRLNRLGHKLEHIAILRA
jgi:uncharacterized protein